MWPANPPASLCQDFRLDDGRWLTFFEIGCNFLSWLTFQKKFPSLQSLTPANKEIPMAKPPSKVTSQKAAKAASSVLRDPKTSAKSKTAAASALAQTPPKKKK